MHSIVTALTFSVYTIAFEWKMGHQNNSKNGSLSLHMQSISIFFAGKSSGLYYIDTIHFLSSEELFFSLSRSIPLPFVYTFINLFWVESFISLTDVGADCMDCVALFHVQMLIVSNSIRYIC